jgi:predicted ATP-grasp superfamily ATP-dependent carboligase
VPSRRPGPAEVASLDTGTPVVLLGGRENTVAVTRNLGRLGIPVDVSGRSGCRAMRSRYCRSAFPVPAGARASDFWRALLLDRSPPVLEGAVVIANCDESMAFVERHQRDLSARYRLEEFRPELRRAMLDKLTTLQLARALGVPTPQFWEIREPADVAALRDEFRLPVVVKPLDTARFAERFGRKLFIVESDFAEVVQKVSLCLAHGHSVMLVEMIPGPDDLLSSHYTYRTPDGRLLYEYTKSVIRRWPVNRGGACFHQSEWLPETAEMGRRLFEGIGWQGTGNVEFKRDPRDGRLKIIEVNGRFTAAHRLVTEAGAPIDLAIYRHLTGQDLPVVTPCGRLLRMWYPPQDVLALLELRRRGELTVGGWLRSLRGQRIVLPYFDPDDPMPWLENAVGGFGKLIRSPARLLRKMRLTRSPRLSPNGGRPMVPSFRCRADLD